MDLPTKNWDVPSFFVCLSGRVNPIHHQCLSNPCAYPHYIRMKISQCWSQVSPKCQVSEVMGLPQITELDNSGYFLIDIDIDIFR